MLCRVFYGGGDRPQWISQPGAHAPSPPLAHKSTLRIEDRGSRLRTFCGRPWGLPYATEKSLRESYRILLRPSSFYGSPCLTVGTYNCLFLMGKLEKDCKCFLRNLIPFFQSYLVCLHLSVLFLYTYKINSVLYQILLNKIANLFAKETFLEFVHVVPIPFRLFSYCTA